MLKRFSWTLLLACTGWLGSVPAYAADLSGISHIAAGGFHTCALTTAGGVKCWGWNAYGQLGDNSTTQRSMPVNVTGLGSRVVAVSVGLDHTCALTTAGGVKCWGDNGSGQLGDSSTTGRLTPIDVPGLASGVAAISAGSAHTCALTLVGGVKCWGHARAVGVSNAYPSSPPVDVTGLASGVVAIAAGTNHTCALTTAGGVKCWGLNSLHSSTPVDVMGLASGVAAIAVGSTQYIAGGDEHACALTTAGGVKCWGWNASGQLGDGTTVQRLTPVDVTGLASGVTAIVAGGYHTCALTTAGGVKCWGDNSSGQLGGSSPLTNRVVAVDVQGLASGVVGLAAGTSHTCALTTSGEVKCWGNDGRGQLGDNFGTGGLMPVDVTGLASGVASLAAGMNHTCALTTAGGVKCWGANSLGQLGENMPEGNVADSAKSRSTPVDVTGLASGVADMALGDQYSCVLTTAGGVKCWGDNSVGQLGDNTRTIRLMPADVTGLASGVAAIEAGGAHTCALTTAGGVKCWGANSKGQLGDNSTLERLVPVDVVGLGSGVAAIAAGGFHTCALTTTGGVKCWGGNSFGQVGDNSTTDRLTPVDVTSLADEIRFIAAGEQHSCALTATGGVKCWGDNSTGQLGDNSTADRLTPVDVVGLASGVNAIAAGAGGTPMGNISHTCALTAAGGVKCWGYNGFGQLGDNSTTNRSAPVDVTGLASGVAAIEAGGAHTCALTTVGGAKCWGYSYFGQLGNGSAGVQRAPVNVAASDNPIVVEFYNTNLDHYFITADSSEAAAIDGGSAGLGWTRTGNTFKSGGDTAVCRFYGSQSPGPNSHFYTLAGSECDGLKLLQATTPATQKRWNFESLDFVSTPASNGTCPSGTTPVYRAYNNGFNRGIDSNHRITSSTASIQEVVNRGWVNEGVVMCAPN